jgi:hypothetical protein
MPTRVPTKGCARKIVLLDKCVDRKVMDMLKTKKKPVRSCWCLEEYANYQVCVENENIIQVLTRVDT